MNRMTRPLRPTLLCRDCGQAVEPWRACGGPGGWLYYCRTEGCYGNCVGWRKDRCIGQGDEHGQADAEVPA